MARGDTASGFTLMEALVAVVIFAAAAIALQNVFLKGGLGLRVSSTEARALEVARAAINKAEYPGSSDASRETSGETDGFSWTATVTRYAPPDGGLLTMKIDAFWIDLDLTWTEQSNPRGPRAVSLRTLKLGAAP